MARRTLIGWIGGAGLAATLTIGCGTALAEPDQPPAGLPGGAAFQVPDAPAFQAPDAPAFQAPEAPVFEAPDAPALQVPEPAAPADPLPDPAQAGAAASDAVGPTQPTVPVQPAVNSTVAPAAPAEPVPPSVPEPVPAPAVAAPDAALADPAPAAEPTPAPPVPVATPDTAAAPAGTTAGATGQDPTAFTGEAPFLPPSFNPVNGAMVGVAKPIIINFQRPIADRTLAEQAIHISSSPSVPGKFYWLTSTQVRWRPYNFWPAHTTVNIDAAGTKSSFRTGDSLIATADDATHQMTITRNGVVEKTMPISMGMSAGGHETPNGTYYVLEKFPSVVMDSSTYGVPVNSSWGYKLTVNDAVRIDNSGGFVHSAPWSVGDQGKRNVSHGCINLSPANAKWFYDNFGSGDPVIVKNSVGTHNKPDGSDDWQWQ